MDRAEPGYLVHEAPGRVRLRMLGRKRDEAWFATTAARIAECPDVVEVEVNPSTASMLLRHRHEFSSVAAWAQRNGLFTVENEPPRGNELIAEFSRGLQEADRSIASLSVGTADFKSLLFLGLVGMSLVQLTRGQILAPASTLLWYALSLAMPGRDKLAAASDRNEGPSRRRRRRTAGRDSNPSNPRHRSQS